MTNEELNKAVAEALGWTDIGVEIERGWVGRPPDRLGYHPIPNWAEDLPACMAPGGPWEWLYQNEAFPCIGFSRRDLGRLYSICGFRALGVLEETASLVEDNPLTACAQAICDAVLAVAEKLRAAFEKGVAAGMAAKDAEWRENIHRLIAAHTEQFRYGGEKVISVDYLEALL